MGRGLVSRLLALSISSSSFQSSLMHKRDCFLSFLQNKGAYPTESPAKAARVGMLR